MRLDEPRDEVLAEHDARAVGGDQAPLREGPVPAQKDVPDEGPGRHHDAALPDAEDRHPRQADRDGQVRRDPGGRQPDPVHDDPEDGQAQEPHERVGLRGRDGRPVDGGGASPVADASGDAAQAHDDIVVVVAAAVSFIVVVVVLGVGVTGRTAGGAAAALGSSSVAVQDGAPDQRHDGHSDQRQHEPVGRGAHLDAGIVHEVFLEGTLGRLEELDTRCREGEESQLDQPVVGVDTTGGVVVVVVVVVVVIVLVGTVVNNSGGGCFEGIVRDVPAFCRSVRHGGNYGG